MNPCDRCEGLAVWGTLVVPATHRVVFGLRSTQHLCTPHVDQAEAEGDWLATYMLEPEHRHSEFPEGPVTE